jgi:probable HAF family extracellular repeat protein
MFIHWGLYSLIGRHEWAVEVEGIALGPDAYSIPRGINSRKQVVGFVSLDCSFDDSSLRAFLWEPGGQMIDLNTLISPSLDMELLNAATINDRGEMAVVADFGDGNRRPVQLTPCNTQQGHSDDCQDSIGLNTTLGVKVNGTAHLQRRGIIGIGRLCRQD